MLIGMIAVVAFQVRAEWPRLSYSIKSLFFGQPPTKPPEPLTVGAQLSLSVDWSQKSKNILLAVSKSCAYCGASFGFYERLVDHVRQTPDARLIVLSPDLPDETVTWFKVPGVDASDVYQIDHRTRTNLGIVVTPTLLLVDRAGLVGAAWYGQLTANEELTALKAVKEGAASVESHATLLREMTEEGLRSLKKDSVVIINPIDQARFVRKDWSGIRLINIPANELSVRAPVEISRSVQVVLDCTEIRLQRCRSAGIGLLRQDYNNVSLLVAHQTPSQ